MQSLPISKSRSEEFDALTQLGRPKIEEIRRKLEGCGEKFLKLEHLSEFMSRFLEPIEAVRIASTAVSLRRIADRLNISADDALERVTAGLQEYGWDERRLSAWADVLIPLREIVTDANIELVVKTSDLYYKHKFHLHDTRVITDIRPVLNDQRNDIDAAIIKNTFIIDYSDGDEMDTTLEINLTSEDLRQIRDEIDRAIAKTELIQRLTERRLGVPAIIFGSDW